MGVFYVGCRIENHTERSKSIQIERLLVDTGSEYTWIPKESLQKINVRSEKKAIDFVMAKGQIITREIGFAIIRVDKFFTIDEIVFALKGDLRLLGARSLEGLNLIVDTRRKKLVAGGPLPAAHSKKIIT